MCSDRPGGAVSWGQTGKQSSAMLYIFTHYSRAHAGSGCLIYSLLALRKLHAVCVSVAAPKTWILFKICGRMRKHGSKEARGQGLHRHICTSNYSRLSDPTLALKLDHKTFQSQGLGQEKRSGGCFNSFLIHYSHAAFKLWQGYVRLL